MMTNGQVYAAPAQQNAPTATPVLLSLPSPLPILPTNPVEPNNVPIVRSPTPEGGAYLEALTEANVRSEPDPESERLGTIRAGDQYAVLGRYYRWYQFQFNQSPSGTGWVFDELVNVTGNTNGIADLTVGTSTPDVAGAQIGATLALITRTPGGILTATAGVGIIPLPLEANIDTDLPVDGNANLSDIPLPTFTAPANVAPINGTAQSADGSLINSTEEPSANIVDINLPSSIPPILPILVLGGFGILGLFVSSSRR